MDTSPSLSLLAERVYGLLRQIPQGRVVTYKALAEAVGCRSPRVIGQILKRNPMAPLVPCHRVIRSDLTPGGYRGGVDGTALESKLALLLAEGVVFRRGVLADTGRLYPFMAPR